MFKSVSGVSGIGPGSKRVPARPVQMGLFGERMESDVLTVEDVLLKARQFVLQAGWHIGGLPSFPPDELRMLLAHHERRFVFSLDWAANREITNQAGTVLAHGYNRMLLTAYGVFVEWGGGHLRHEAFGRHARADGLVVERRSLDSLATSCFEFLVLPSWGDFVKGMFYANAENLWLPGIGAMARDKKTG